MTGKTIVPAACAAIVLAALVAGGKTEESSGSAVKTSEASVVTNDNGSVSRSFTECNVTTNGSMVTERRRETRTVLDTEGNVLETSTSEYAQSYTVGAEPEAFQSQSSSGEADARDSDSFLGVKFGDKVESESFEQDPSEPALVFAKFTPEKTLDGFDAYYVYVTPKTHRAVKILACAKEAVEPGARWRRHYLVEALEKRYGTWARLCSVTRPLYAFDIGSGRYVTACLAGASRSWETVLAAWDDALLTEAADEAEELRREARKAAQDKRRRRVEEAAGAF